jgi:hypothetical protein
VASTRMAFAIGAVGAFGFALTVPVLLAPRLHSVPVEPGDSDVGSARPSSESLV